MYCSSCGTLNHDNNYRCTECGHVLQAATSAPPPQAYAPPPQAWTPPPPQQVHAPLVQQPPGPAAWGPGAAQPPPVAGAPHYALVQKSRGAAAVLQLFLPFGVGRFYLGYTGIGVAQLLLSVFCGIGVIWCFIDGIMMLTGNPSTDANGVPLKS